ncbi:MAG: type II toxin-antitoxin system VapC family toxin [Methylococcales symbiont of Hymedesmia sp. n. MRB-2018]|nr:MAG: type II toxin-antitoxin system VapC family toxin [Methylococcales symbiont of Hymedesmia sp. n. MRB-2018]KAF3983791.1 MAG: type II toxin-antitoxin system VapC family toxin [Methylococcales symbiont of Hymedesmia sp. n. MRB-2018]
MCCLNRPFDDQKQDRVHLEAEAIISVLNHIDEGEWELVSSDAVIYEINKTVDAERRERLLSINNSAQSYVVVDKTIFERGAVIQEMGFTTYDAMHIACAESVQVDIFLSTDKKLINRGLKNKNKLFIAIDNPLAWIQKEF